MRSSASAWPRAWLAADTSEVMAITSRSGPCNDVCKMDDRSGLCLGCYRTLDEIATWSALDDAGRQAVVELLESRRAAARAERAARREAR